MRKRALWIALAVAGVIAAAAALAWAATPAGQFTLALWRTPAAAEGALRSLMEDGGVQLLAQSHESRATASLTGITAPGLAEGAAKVLAATKLQVDSSYDNDTAEGMLTAQVTSGAVPLLGVSMILSGNTLAVKSSELLDGAATLPVGGPGRPGTPLERRLRGIGGTSGSLTAGLMAARLQQLAPAGSFTLEQRSVELLGQPQACAAITLRLQGKALADAGLAMLRDAAGDAALRGSLSGWSPALAAAMEQAVSDPDALRQRLSQCTLTATVLRRGITAIGWEVQWQQPGGTLRFSAVAYAQGQQLDLRLSHSRDGVAALEASLLRTVGEDGRQALAVRVRANGWELLLNGQQGAMEAETRQDMGSFCISLPGGGQAEGVLERTLETGTAVDVQTPQWSKAETRDIGNDPASVRALLEGMGERLRGLLASMGLIRR